MDSQKLNDLKYAIDELEIVAVYPKPDGLNSDLTAGSEFMDNEENQLSLAERGFYPQPLDDGKFADWAALLFDQALLAEGGQLEDPAAFVRRVNQMLVAG